jgi:hypothetical protein
MESYSIAILGILALMSIWILIQMLWKKTFAEYVSDEDAMADRTKCSNCNCTTACENNPAEAN